MIIGLAVLAIASAIQQPPALKRALWVWSGKEIVQAAGNEAKFFGFLQSPLSQSGKSIKTIFIAGLPIDEGSDGPTKEFLTKAHQQSIRVDFLCGDPSWVEPNKQSDGLDVLKSVIAFNDRSPDAKFDGIQFDVEPYLLKGWPSQDLVNEYLGFLTHALVTAGSLPIGAAIPHWFDDARLGGLHKKVMDRVSYVAVMDYVDRPDSFTSLGQNEIVYGATIHKPVWLGVETKDLPKEPKATFFLAGNAVMELSFDLAVQRFGSMNSFAGVAIHDYDSYLILKP